MNLVVLFALASAALAAKDPATTVLNEWPMIMVHDAATSYLEGGALHQINDWAKTQVDGGAQGELNCGARAFDWRPSLGSDGTVKMHHGSVNIDHAMADSLDEMVRWAAANGTAAQDLVVLGITACSGTGCADAVRKLLDARNITYITDCSELKGLTVAAAHDKAALPGGGAILATFDCWVENYDSSVACSGFGGKDLGDLPPPGTQAGVSSTSATYTCYTDSDTRDFPVQRMKSYIKKVVAGGAPSDGQLYTVQALWQESAASVTVGELHGSNLLEDESRSALNSMVASMIQNATELPDVSQLNMVEVNNVCDGGAHLLSVLRAI